MSSMEKLLTVVSIGQRAYGRWLFQRLLPSIIVVVGLTIIISIMVSAVLVGGFYAAYLALINYGTEPQMAIIIISMSSLITIVLLVLLTFLGLRHLHQMPKTMVQQSPLTTGAMDALGSFFDGFIAG